MAEGWARHLKANVVDAHSAGVRPHGMNELAIQVMKEAGVDISRQRSKHVDELANVRFDLAVTVCDDAREACPVFPGVAKFLHVPFDDPPRLTKTAVNEAEALAHYRRVRDEIRQFVQQLELYLPPRDPPAGVRP